MAIPKITVIKRIYTQTILVLPHSLSIFVNIFFKKSVIGNFSIKLDFKFLSLMAFIIKKINTNTSRYNIIACKAYYNFNCSTSDIDIK